MELENSTIILVFHSFNSTKRNN